MAVNVVNWTGVAASVALEAAVQRAGDVENRKWVGAGGEASYAGTGCSTRALWLLVVLHRALDRERWFGGRGCRCQAPPAAESSRATEPLCATRSLHLYSPSAAHTHGRTFWTRQECRAREFNHSSFFVSTLNCSVPCILYCLSLLVSHRLGPRSGANHTRDECQPANFHTLTNRWFQAGVGPDGTCVPALPFTGIPGTL